MDFWISKWISGFQSGFRILQRISGFQIGFQPKAYEISPVADPSVTGLVGGESLSVGNLYLVATYYKRRLEISA